ncbi:uncharacterized protein LOC107267336 isoform X1 [Cephus cinctus]|uniref:Uncharacterized protein LOC107267336 isoform X1 n=1 Tax=Cephus cinctus TaxID=211228 RepID=A0AAJ7W1Q0_CEPCN|nr:uncharacterized protein LOC107267336 isoform X1 [Cephus cinctus]
MVTGDMLYVFGILVVLIVDITGIIKVQGKPQQIKPGCRFEGRRYREGDVVNTSEPCLQCRCVEGSPRCRLRVCPRLPNPPPPGCRVRPPGEKVCCAEIICGRSSWNLLVDEADNDLRRISTGTGEKSETDGCLHEGVKYGPGSAMMGARRCEYCYCISGSRRCVRPKCLLPLPGCTPLYAPHSCCPVAYNCTHPHASTTITSLAGNGCRVGERIYEEGEMVREIGWKAPCDNCFCAMGAVRCVPLSCAPPLQGCSPIVREGQCCPSTYNCSGSIEVKATQNYASYAFISKDYAKFRKETNFFPIDNSLSNAIPEGRGHRIVDKNLSISNDSLTLNSTDTTISLEESSTVDTASSITLILETETMDNEILAETTDSDRYTTTLESTSTQTSTEMAVNQECTFSDTTTWTIPDHHTASTSLLNSPTSVVESTTIDEIPSTVGLTEDPSTLSSDTVESTTSTPREGAVTEQQDDETKIIDSLSQSTIPVSNASSLTESSSTINIEDVEHTIDREKFSNIQMGSIKGPVTSLPTTILMPDDILVMNVTVKTNVSVGHIQGVTINPVRSIPPDVEAILNITHREKGEDYEYDYGEPTLPPSLPNVRIIPFVAADALVKDDKDIASTVTGYPSGSVGVPPELHPTDVPGFYDIVTQENRFSPPVETEGGFVPREPSYFDPPSYHSTDLNLEIGTGVTVLPAAITNPHRKNDEDLASDCLFENREYQHGALLPSSGLCIICICYYGDVVCSDEKCPPLKIGCRRVNVEKECCGKNVCVDADESPTVVLDRADATAPSQRQPITFVDGIVSPDPFRDVIKTEPAPDLPSLIEDMIPYLVEHGITTPRPTTPMTTTTSQKLIVQNVGSNKLQHYKDFIGIIPLVHGQSYEYHREEDTPSLLTSNKDAYDFPTVPESSGTIQYGPNDSTKEDSTLDSGIRTSGFTYNNHTLSRLDYSTPEVTTGSIDQNHSMILVNVTDTKESGPLSNSKIVHPTDHKILINENMSNPDLSTLSITSTETLLPHQDEEDASIFSFDSVLDLLFSGTTTTKVPKMSTTKHPEDFISSSSPTKPPATSVSIKAPFTTRSTTLPPSTRKIMTTTAARTTGTTSTTLMPEKTMKLPTSSSSINILDNDVPLAVASLLKLAGCNIYGRMYRVGRIITELSGPCLECRCTEIGVQCEELGC